MPAVKSDNPLHAEINKYFNVHISEYVSTEIIDGKKINKYKRAGICSANEVSQYIGDEELKIKLFNKVLECGMDRYTTLVRNRLKIDFYSK
ncbi:hypothetical protein [Flavobacterium sp. AG291]|uniref:hypothetical protein n=1 Tax=Flavobacterium sp. AG291 TaxID=2184000 RepID=UPI000E0C5FE7|nr:hypothetical protein [Flavobacterium sp. AG291]RDI07060.1 hypothetical protein DEU42_113160 [Flavobacterium sp. AG291]